MMWLFDFTLLVFTIGTLFAISNAEFFTSLDRLETLQRFERDISSRLSNYISAEESRIASLKKAAGPRLGEEWKKIVSDSEGSHNPINAFKLLKGAVDYPWQDLIDNIMVDNTDAFVRGLESFNDASPSKKDLWGAADGLNRIVDTYQLMFHDVAMGLIPRVSPTSPLSAEECYFLGSAAFQGSDYYHAIQWLHEAEEALNKRQKGTPQFQHLPQLFDLLSQSLYHQGNHEWAVWYGRLLKSAGRGYKAQSDLSNYEAALHDSGSFWNGSKNSLPSLDNSRHSDFGNQRFESLCRGKFYLPKSEEKKLNCFYKRDKNFLRFAPIKTEFVHRDPEIYLFRDVVSDREIKTLKSLSFPKLTRSYVFARSNKSIDEEGSMGNETRPHIPAEYRISQIWLSANVHEVLKKINKRIEDMTNLGTEFSEELQMANYGVGGHYLPHLDIMGAVHKDHMGRSKDFLDSNGERIATVLFYMSQPSGGATVFVDLGVGVFPSKNDALFWHNLHENGEPDWRTKHGACPVLAGGKWAANKWLHEFGQEFRRPCPAAAHPAPLFDAILR